MRKAHLVQLDLAWEDKLANYRRLLRLLTRAAISPGDVVVLPEMFDTGFSFNLEVTADTDQSTLQFLMALAKEAQVVLVGSRTVIRPTQAEEPDPIEIAKGGRAEKPGRNRCTILDSHGEVIGEYDKVHPFSYGKEAEHFAGGSQVVVVDVAEVSGASSAEAAAGSPAFRLCPTICYDLRFPELYRRGLLQGAEVFTVIANWPSSRAMHRKALTIARAIENQAIVLCVNRTGSDPHLSYFGESLAVGPKGDILGQAGPEETVLTVPLDVAAVTAWRREFPAWRDIKLL
jgi:omega-amidase